MNEVEEKFIDESQIEPRKSLDLRPEKLNRTMWSLAFPAIIENLMGMLVYLADAFIVGWLKDANALAGTMLAGTLFMVTMAPFQGIAVATTSLVARNWGAKEYDKAQRYGNQALCFGLFFGLGLMFVGFLLSDSLFHWFGASEPVIKLGGTYLRIVIITIPLEMLMFIASGIMRGSGDTKSPMYITVTMNVINILLCIILAFGFNLGLIGVAYGSMIAQALGGLFALFMLERGWSHIKLPVRNFFCWNKQLLKELITLAYPVAIERFIGSGAHLIFMKIIAMLGTIAIAAHFIAVRLESLAFMPAFGINVAVMTIVGQSLGARKTDIAELSVRRAMLWTTGFMLGLGIIFVSFAHSIVVLFGATPEVIRLAGLALQISALELPFLSYTMILSGCLRGAGDTKSPLYNMIVCVLLFRFGVVYLFAITFGWGLAGVWLATAIDWFGRTVGLWYVFKRGKWKLIPVSHPTN
ncbi:MAG: MATE family efflux transporter [bacterium]|nr:MATE family efflux transporter [bacterium]